MATALTSLLTRFTDKCNRVLAGGIVKTYEPNSLTPKVSYQDPEGTIPNLPEVVLDETGRAKIYLLGDYRVQVYSNDGVLIEDNLLVEQALVQRDFDNLSTDIQQQVDEAKQAFENTGGFISAPTFTALQAITPEYDYQLARVDATGDEYRWNPALTTTVKWEPTGRNFLSESKVYTDEKVAASSASSSDALQSYADSLQDDKTDPLLAITDPNGFNFAQLTRYGLQTEVVSNIGDDNVIQSLEDSHGFIVEQQTANAKIDVSGTWEYTKEKDYIVTDPFGFVLMSAKQAGLGSNSGSSNTSREDLIQKLESQALAVSAAVPNKYLSNIARPVYDYNIVVTYGQSLSTGTEGWPALTKLAVDVNLLMLGDSTRPNTMRENGGSTWDPVGASQFNTLKSVVQSSNGTTILTDAEVAALAAGATNEGESIEHGAVNYWRSLQNGLKGLAVNPNRKIVVVNCGVQGRTVEQLSRGNALNHFNRIVEAVTKVKNQINSIDSTATIGHVATLYCQGEWNYQYSDTDTKASFKAATVQLKNDIYTYVTNAILGQTVPASFITYQTGGVYTKEKSGVGLYVGMAQIEMSDENEDVFLASPNYPYPDKNGHLDPNGYRWLGCQFGKVLHRIVDRGQDWKPLKPISAKILDNEILVNFCVPIPPLKFKEIYDVLTTTTYANKGFAVYVDGVNTAISSVSIIGSATVSITLASKPAGALIEVWYAGKTTYNGNGNLCDSDSTVPIYNYEYHADTGQYPAANIASLVDKPYSLNNFCCAFQIQASFAE